MPLAGKYLFNYFQFQWSLGGMHAEFLVQQLRRYLPSYYNFSWFKLKDKCRSVKLEVYLYGDMTIQVVRAHVQFLVSCHMPVVV